MDTPCARPGLNFPEAGQVDQEGQSTSQTLGETVGLGIVPDVERLLQQENHGRRESMFLGSLETVRPDRKKREKRLCEMYMAGSSASSSDLRRDEEERQGIEERGGESTVPVRARAVHHLPSKAAVEEHNRLHIP